MRWDLLAVAIALLSLAIVYWRDREIRRRLRGEFFGDCLNLFQACRVTQDDIYYPVLTGKYGGFDVRLEPVVDHIAWRKIPSLWLKVSVLRPVRHRGVFDLLMRPQAVEFYSPSGALEDRVPVPADWPQDAVVYTDDAAAMPSLQAVQPHIHIFADPKMKELVIAPGGVRLVYQVCQADRSHYAVLRQIEFPETRLRPDLAKRLIDSAIEIYESVAAA
jgi:hypothetical protein